MIDLEVIRRVQATVAARKGAPPDSSYVASLYAKGTDTICKKLVEEAAETIMAAKDGNRMHLVNETCDLWFHSLVLLAPFVTTEGMPMHLFDHEQLAPSSTTALLRASQCSGSLLQ